MHGGDHPATWVGLQVEANGEIIAVNGEEIDAELLE